MWGLLTGGGLVAQAMALTWSQQYPSFHDYVMLPTALCTFTVTVLDEEPPAFEGCKEDWTVVQALHPDKKVIGHDGKLYSFIDWAQPIATDNLGFTWSYTSKYAIYNTSAEYNASGPSIVRRCIS